MVACSILATDLEIQAKWQPAFGTKWRCCLRTAVLVIGSCWEKRGLSLPIVLLQMHLTYRESKLSCGCAAVQVYTAAVSFVHMT